MAGRNFLIIFFICCLISSSSRCGMERYLTKNVFDWHIAWIFSFWPIKCFMWLMWELKLNFDITLFRINLGYQTHPAKRVIKTCHMSLVLYHTIGKLGRLNHEYQPEMRLCTIACLQFWMMTVLWSGGCFEYLEQCSPLKTVPQVIYALHPCFFADPKEFNFAHFLLAYIKHNLIV